MEKGVRELPAINGSEYIDRINQNLADIRIDGVRVKGKVSEHPAFKGIMKSQAALYDLQLRDDVKNFMTYPSPTTGKNVGTSFLEPKTKEDLAKRRQMVQTWARSSAGLLGRSPDYMNTVLMSFAAASKLFSDANINWGKNLIDLYERAREQDLSFTHTFVQPQVDRSKLYVEDTTDITAAKIVKKTDEGMIIKGARLLATQGGITDEILVFPSGAQLSIDPSFVYAFSLPSNTPGLKFICRESFDYGKSQYDHPLSSRFDEMDTIVIFDDVLVPWDRVFLCEDMELGGCLYKETGFFPQVMHQIVSRTVVKTEFILGLIQAIIDAINIGEYQHVQAKTAEVIMNLEILKSLLLTSELQATIDKWGTMTPDMTPLYVAINYFPKMYPRMIEILQLLGASGNISIPSEKEFETDLKDELNQYLKTFSMNGYDKVKLFRLAWDLSMSAFGSRQVLYERFFFGDPVRLSSNLFNMYDRTSYKKQIMDFLN